MQNEKFSACRYEALQIREKSGTQKGAALMIKL